METITIPNHATIARLAKSARTLGISPARTPIESWLKGQVPEKGQARTTLASMVLEEMARQETVRKEPARAAGKARMRRMYSPAWALAGFVDYHKDKPWTDPAPRFYVFPEGTPEQRLENRTLDAVRRAARATLRQAVGKWAGGDTTISVGIGDHPDAAGTATRVWSKNGKWSGLDAHYRIVVPRSWFRIVGKRDAGCPMRAVGGLATAGGLLTLDATPREIPEGMAWNGAWDATWARNGRGFEVIIERGIIVKVGDRWIHGKSETAIRRLLSPSPARKPDPERTRRATWTRWENQHGNVLVTVDQHRSAGNCREGTEQWAARHLDGRTSATVKELVAWLKAGGTDQPERVESAIRAAIRAAIR